MRNRAWRRYTDDKILIRRLKKFSNDKPYYHFRDSAGYIVENPKWVDIINTRHHFNLKSIGKPWRSSGYRIKYSRKKSLSGRNAYHRKGNIPGTREFNKRILIKIRKEYGIK